MVMLYLGWTIWLGSRLPDSEERPRPKRDCGGTPYAVAVTSPSGAVCSPNFRLTI